MAKKTLDPNWKQEFYNGISCGHTGCGDEKKPCQHCGRIAFRGNVLIQNRTGYVHLERVNLVNKNLYIKQTPEEQEAGTIMLWIGPGEIAEF